MIDLQRIKKEALVLSTEIDEATGKLVNARLAKDDYKARNAELRLLSLTNASEQFCSWLIVQIEKEESK